MPPIPLILIILMLFMSQVANLAAGQISTTGPQTLLAPTIREVEPIAPLSVLPGTNHSVWILGVLAAAAWTLIGGVIQRHPAKECLPRENIDLRLQAIIRTRDTVIFALSKLVHSRDPETGQHLNRTAAYSTLLASAIQRHPTYRGAVTNAFVQAIGIHSVLHDIGKVGIPDHVLLKPGALDEDEMMIMRSHPQIGADCIELIQHHLGDTTCLQMAHEIALYHHERWDGTGYPSGICGKAIPLSARVVMIADVYDTLTSRRIYKDPYSHQASVEMIRQAAGRHFDPQLVEIFLSLESQFQEIAISLRSSPG